MLNNLYKRIIGVVLVIFFILPGTVIARQANDPLNNELGYLDIIKATDAWDYTTGSRQVVVAVIDTGIDIDHPDIYQNIWTNSGEIAGDGIDNDNNGYVDDIHGWDFIHDEADPNPKFDSDFSKLGIEHGTLVAGIIGARGNNNYGIAGLNWQVSLMSLIALDGKGNGSILDVIKALNYATDNGADIINLSLVGTVTSPALETAIANAYNAGVVIVAATGNESSDDGNDVSVDMSVDPRYPVCLDGPDGKNYILGVGSVDQYDKKSLFSNYGTSCLDINAPGQYIFGLNIYQPIFYDYRVKFDGYWSGTSLATSLVTGTAALIKAYRPNLSNQEIYNLILDNADDIDGQNTNFQNKLGQGRLNLARIFEQASRIDNRVVANVVAAQSGFKPEVILYDNQGNVITKFLAYDQNFKGGINLAIGDVNDDGMAEIITGAGQTGGPHIRVFNNNGQPMSEFFALDQQNSNGVRVTVLNNRIITWSQDFSYPYIQIYTYNGELLSQFKISEKIFDISAGDIDQDGVQEINVLTEGKITIYSQLGYQGKTILLDDTAGDLEVMNNRIVVGSHSGQAPVVTIYDFAGNQIKKWLAYDENFKGGVNLAIDNDQIITGAGQGGGPHLRAFAINGNLQYEYFTLDYKTHGGINVGFIN